MLLQGGFAVVVLVAALALRGPLEDGLFDGDTALYWVLLAGVAFYAASYFARGWLAGHQWFGLYGGLVFMESASRLLFALAVAVGIAHGQTAVALGMAAAPLVSLVVVPLAFRARAAGEADAEVGGAPARRRRDRDDLALTRGGRFAVAVLAVMLAEQTLINGAVLTVNATAADAAVAGFVFNALLIARAPLQLFQAIQGSLLPHLAGLNATDEGGGDSRRAIRITVAAIAAFAGACAIGLLLIGPWVMGIVFDSSITYGRVGLAVVAMGMGLHLVAGTLNQAALARDHAVAAAACWLTAAALFLAWMISGVVGDQLLRAELGYALAAAVLCALLAALYVRPSGAAARG